MATCLQSRKLYKSDEPDTQDTAGEARTNSSVMYSYGPPHMAKQKQDDQLEHTYSSYVRIRDVALKTCQKRWMIGRSGERGSGISVLAARHDDDNFFVKTNNPNKKIKIKMLQSINLLSYAYMAYLRTVVFWLVNTGSSNYSRKKLEFLFGA